MSQRSIVELILELFAENGLKRYDLVVSEDEGRVHLSGSVERWHEVVLAGQLTGRLKGVRSVVNEIVPLLDKVPEYRMPAGNSTVIGAADVVVIGGGVIGCAIARELTRYQLDVVLLEKDADVACGASKANNGMIHSGLVQEPGSLRRKLNVRGNTMFENICRQLDVPFKRTGLIGVVFKEEELFLLDLIRSAAVESGIPVEVIGKELALAVEPHLSPEVKGAFLAPTTAMTSPYKLTIAYAENAVTNGARLFLNTAVTAFERQLDGATKVITSRGSFLSRFCVNAAGIYADHIAAMAGPPEFTIHPRKGELLIFDPARGGNHAAMATGVLGIGHDPLTKGGGTMLTVDGNPEWGPTAIETPDREDTSVSAEGIEAIIDKFKMLLPGYDPGASLIAYFAGLRAATYTEEFHIAPSMHWKGLINVAGIQSPGLAAAPAIAEMALEILEDEGLPMVARDNFEPHRRDLLRFKTTPPDQQDALIKSNPLYGHVICRCEHVTEGEIVEALHRPVPALTLDALKRRTRAGMGRCQGSFCVPRVLPIISRELGIPMERLTKNGPGSRIFSRPTKTAPPLMREDRYYE